MSLRFKSELRLELRMRSCQAELLPPGWRTRPAAVASGTGEGAAALNAAMSALRLADVDELPGKALSVLHTVELEADRAVPVDPEPLE